MNRDKETQEALLKAIDIMIDNKLKNLGFNYYVDGVIKAKNTNNTYNVLINGSVYNNIPSKNNFSYHINDVVQILIKNGDWNKKFIDDKKNHNETPLYPVGSVYISSTNTNPANTFGGTWTLIDKSFSDKTSNASVNFTPNSDIVDTYELAFARNNHSIYTRFIGKLKVDLNDTTVTLGTVNLQELGITDVTYTKNVVGWSDDGNGVFMVTFANKGAVKIEDIVAKSSATTIVAGRQCQFECVHEVAQSVMLDSACDKFYWKRTA